MAATTALTAVSGGFDLFSGLLGMSAADAQNSALRSQARLLQAESEADIARYASESRAFKAEQSVRYLKSGVTLEGSPLEILDETSRVAAENISAMRARTAAEAGALRAKGRGIQAASRVEFLKDVAGAGLTAMKTGKELGWFRSAAPAAPSTNKVTRVSRQGSGGKLDLGYF